MATKTTCPVSRQQFTTHAKPITVTLPGATAYAVVKMFESGSLGWNATTKITVVIDGVPCQVQVGLNMTIVGSKDLPKAAYVASADVQGIIDRARALEASKVA